MHTDCEKDFPATEDPQSPKQLARDAGGLACPSTGRAGGAGCLVKPAARPALHPWALTLNPADPACRLLAIRGRSS
jgi:hypothetical protein